MVVKLDCCRFVVVTDATRDADRYRARDDIAARPTDALDEHTVRKDDDAAPTRRNGSDADSESVDDVIEGCCRD